MSLMYNKWDYKIYLDFRGHNQQNSIFSKISQNA
jgi:hypothetical protein